MIYKLQRKTDEIRKSPPALTPLPHACLDLFLLLSTFEWELPNIGSYQEVHNRLIAFLHGQQLKHLHFSASARSPSPCLSHHFPECFLQISPLAAVEEEMLNNWATVQPLLPDQEQVLPFCCPNGFSYDLTGMCSDLVGRSQLPVV